MSVSRVLPHQVFAGHARHGPQASARPPSVSTRRQHPQTRPHEADELFNAIQKTKISAPGDRLHLPDRRGTDPQGMHQVVPGEFYAAATRPPGRLSRQSVPDRSGPGLRRRRSDAERHAKTCSLELLEETDARTVRQFLIHTFNGLGARRPTRSSKPPRSGRARTPANSSPRNARSCSTR